MSKRLNEQMRRNQDRFPEDFAFQLSDKEWDALRSQYATPNKGRGGRRYRPFVFTEHGALMAANELNSPQAVTIFVLATTVFSC
ncbi:MAG: ORF6N domain-containing protein [Methylacidiphilales bacterium]|nr:ORF6N domain-containing protein [Candidatus Methylacidiphilales bacterium]